MGLRMGSWDLSPEELVELIVSDARLVNATYGLEARHDHMWDRVQVESGHEVFLVSSGGSRVAAFEIDTYEDGTSQIGNEYFCLDLDDQLVDVTFQGRAFGNPDFDNDQEVPSE